MFDFASTQEALSSAAPTIEKRNSERHRRSTKLAGVAALVAAAGTFASHFWAMQATLVSTSMLQPVSASWRQLFLQISPDWSPTNNVVGYAAALLLMVCGVALLRRSRDWASGLVIAPASIVGLGLATSAGRLLSTYPVTTLKMGFWAAVVGAAGCAVTVAMASVSFIHGPRNRPGDQPATVAATVVARIGMALALAGALTTRAVGPSGLIDPGLLRHPRDNFELAFSLGLLAVIALAPGAIRLSRTHRTAPLAFGIAAAVLLWDGTISRVVFRSDNLGFHVRIGFWFLTASSVTFLLLGFLLHRGSSDKESAGAARGIEAPAR